jgi:transcriptional regulator GlxA family with amidase domain
MSPQKIIGLVLFEGFEVLDVFGPVEAYASPALNGAFRVLMIGQTPGPVASAQGPKSIADVGFDDCPSVDVLVVPGGIGTRREVDNSALLSWLRARAETAELVSSVCTGAALLARAGLLDGRRATTNKRAFDWVESQGPRVKWIREARWVEDGKFATSAGVSAGIDMALGLIARMHTTESAEKVAIQMEYEWHRDATRDPFAKVKPVQ